MVTYSLLLIFLRGSPRPLPSPVLLRPREAPARKSWWWASLECLLPGSHHDMKAITINESTLSDRENAHGIHMFTCFNDNWQTMSQWVWQRSLHCHNAKAHPCCHPRARTCAEALQTWRSGLKWQNLHSVIDRSVNTSTGGC